MSKVLYYVLPKKEYIDEKVKDLTCKFNMQNVGERLYGNDDVLMSIEKKVFAFLVYNERDYSLIQTLNSEMYS